MTYQVARLDDIEVFDDGRCPWRPIRHHFGISAFGVNSWTARDEGDRIVNEHDEADEDEELYVVLRGRATFELDGERVDAPEGTLVFAQPGVKRTAFAEEAGTTILAVGAQPGKAYEAIGWELWAPAGHFYQAGEYEQAIEVAKPLVEANPGYSALLYNLACCESLAGRDGRRARPPAAGDRADARGPRVGPARLRLRPDPRESGLRRARRRTLETTRAASFRLTAPVGSSSFKRPSVALQRIDVEVVDLTWRCRQPAQRSPGNRKPPARARMSGTGSREGRATTSTAP